MDHRAGRYGGRGLSDDFQRIWNRVATDYQTPSLSIYGIGLGMVAPTILAHATDEVKEAYLRKMWRGDIVACQLFSEPSSGSDLASLQTRAVRDGDEWIINGQKVWTSGAQVSDIGEIICRTDPDLPKHRGLTGFVVDMHAPGVEVRPLRQMTGGASFNEVFFTDVRIPDSHRLGDVNGGWTVALTTLMNERAAIGGGGGGVGLPTSTRLIEVARATGTNTDPLVRQQIAEIVINDRVAGYTNRRAMAKIAQGQLPGPEMSLAKLSLTANMVRTYEALSSMLGPKLVVDTGEWGTYAWTAVPARRARNAHRRRIRRGHAQHHRRAGPRPAQGAGPAVAGPGAAAQVAAARDRPLSRTRAAARSPGGAASARAVGALPGGRVCRSPCWPPSRIRESPRPARS